MRFSLLGPLQVVDSAGASRVVSAAKQRIVLATLLLSNNRIVSAAELAEALWDDSPPLSAAAVIRTYVARLRRALGPAGGRIVGQPPGWAIDLHSAGELDLAEVDGLWRAARAAGQGGDWHQVSSLLARALKLWRGEPLADVPSAVLALREGARLAELHMQLTEARIDADLTLGRQGELVTELRRLTGEYPLREHLRAQLMLACYRCGHQAAALEVYRDARATLAGELGVEPGRELQDLHQQILAGDRELTVEVPATAGASPRRGGPDNPARGTPGQPTDPARARIPRQLPAAVRSFAGRQDELASLTRLLGQAEAASDAVAVAVVRGTAGVGKTALALHWAHQVASRFPDGQMYLNLRGFDPSGRPMRLAEALRALLAALGVPVTQIPAGLDAQAGLYRSLLSGRRVLVVLDNARDSSQVRPLLPGSPANLVLVTSRNQLSGLVAVDGAWPLTLDVLDQGDAHALLARRLGQARLDAEPDAAAELISLCARLPLALAIAAAQVSARPRIRLAEFAGELRDGQRTFDALDAGDGPASVRAVFSWSTARLSVPAVRLFGFLGVHPGPDISIPAAASLAGTPLPRTRQALDELAEAHLVTEHSLGRFGLHDLLRAYAAEQAASDETACQAALGRVFDHYVHTASAAAFQLNPSLFTRTRPQPGTSPETITGHQHALDWFEAEREVLISAVAMAARTGFDTCAWQLAWSLEDFLDRRGHWDECAAIQRIALAAATRDGNLAGQAAARRHLAWACSGLTDYAEAAVQLTTCLDLHRQMDDRRGEARTHQALGAVATHQTRHADALGHAEQALALFRAIADRPGEAGALNDLGYYHAALGDYQQARRLCGKSLALNQELGNREVEAIAWDSLGYAEHHLGHPAEAAACYQSAIGMYREFGNRIYQADALSRLGDSRQAAGDQREARDSWQQALAIYDSLDDSKASQVRAKLKRLGVDAQPSGSPGCAGKELR